MTDTKTSITYRTGFHLVCDMMAKSAHTRFCTQRALLVGTPYDLYLLTESGFCLTQVAFHDDGLCDDVVLDLASTRQEAVEKISAGNYQLVITDHIAGGDPGVICF